MSIYTDPNADRHRNPPLGLTLAGSIFGVYPKLFDPTLQRAAFETAVAEFQITKLSKSALALAAIMRAGAAAGNTGTLVDFPNGETRQLA